MKKDSIAAMMPLFLVIAIDSMGLGILFPLLSSMIIDPHSTFLAASTSTFMREFLYGLIVAIYMLAWFFGAAILGDLSDVLGRKRSLLVCLLGAAIGYAISGASFYIHSLTLLIVGRLIAGFTAGSQPIAQAAIVDMSSAEHKARNIGYVLLATSLGFVLGPLAGGVLSDARLVSWFDFATPLFFAAIFSLLNIVFLSLLFKESHKITRKIKIRLHYAIQIFIEAFQHKKIRRLSLVLLIFISGWGGYFGFVSQYLLRTYHYTPLKTALFMTTMAVGFSIGFAILVDWCSARFTLKASTIVGLIVAGILCFMSVIPGFEIFAWCASVVIGIGVAVAYSLIVTMFSNQVSENEQGWVMGVTNSVMALSFGLTTLFAGFAANISPAMPIIWSGAGILIAAFFMLFVPHDPKDEPVKSTEA